MTEPSARLRSLIEPLVETAGLYLFDLEQTGGKLVVTVDSPGGAADMAAIAQATRAISRALDAEDPISGRYLLEVTSPGVERPLRTPAHFGWAVGKDVTVRLNGDADTADTEGGRRFTGVLQGADDDGITLLPDEAGATPVTLSYDDIQRARTVFDFEAELKAAKHATPGPPGSSGGRGRAHTG